MKTTSQKKSNRLPQESKLSAQAAQAQPTAAPAQPVEKKDERLPIDTETRKHNRTLPTEKVLAWGTSFVKHSEPSKSNG